MELGRFHFAVWTFLHDLAETEAADGLQNLASALNTVAANPAQPQYFEQYKSLLEELRQRLSKSKLNSPKLELSSLIEELGLEGYFGNGLFDSVIDAISANALSPQQALAALHKIISDLNQKVSHLKSIRDAFGALDISFDGEGDEDAEIEIRIPADYGKKTLADLSRETKEWHRDLSTISEVFDPERPEPLVRVLSTGSWEFYLASAPLVIFGISRCLKGINTILGDLIKSRQLLAQLISSKAPTEVVSRFESHLTQSVGTNLTELANTLVDEHYKGTDDGRRAELKNALGQSLKRLSKKLSEGSKISLRLTAPKEPKVADAANPTPEESAELARITTYEDVRKLALESIDQTPPLNADPEITAALPAPDAEY